MTDTIVLEDWIVCMAQDYVKARRAKNWKAATHIRNELKRSQIVLECIQDGVMWRHVE